MRDGLGLEFWETGCSMRKGHESKGISRLTTRDLWRLNCACIGSALRARGRVHNRHYIVSTAKI